MKRPLWKLYWVWTEDHDEDWFIVARSKKKATQLFEEYEGYLPKTARAERVLTLPSSAQDTHNEADVDDEQACWPTEELLIKLGGTPLKRVPGQYCPSSSNRVYIFNGQAYHEELIAQTVSEAC